MAERRMFAKSIVLSDAFLDMPMSARCLYFTLSMFADDDGFVGSPKGIMRQCGASDDDLQVLLAKRFILGFESGVIVVKHWRINNYLRNDRHQNTTYIEELNQLDLDSKQAYIEKGRDSSAHNLLLEPKEKKPLTEAQQKRYQAKKESDLPYSFEYKIRRAFENKTCPICGCIMQGADFLRKPTIQHNVPISKGGKHELDNISVICNCCNSSVSNRTETPPYNTEEVKKMWECIGNGAGMETEYSIGKYSIVEDSIIDNQNKNKVYGICNNVNLSDEEFEKLKKAFPKDYQYRINRLSTYMSEHNKTYKNHYATIVMWAERDKAQAKGNTQKHFENEREYSDADLDEILNRDKEY